tara:strand:- start:430 stop:699 length:270 start_codon:yes stop_codon:yes gene_type:complete
MMISIGVSLAKKNANLLRMEKMLSDDLLDMDLETFEAQVLTELAIEGYDFGVITDLEFYISELYDDGYHIYEAVEDILYEARILSGVEE